MSTRSTITPCMIVAILFLFVPNMTIYYFQCNYSLFYWPKQQVTEDSGRLFTGSNDQTVRSYDIKVPNTINVACEQAFAAFFVCLLVCFLPSFLPSHPPPPSFIFWLSFHFSRGQNRKPRSSVFFCSETKRKRLLRRLFVSYFLWESLLVQH